MHIPVLLKEVIEYLNFEEKDKIFLDATLGAGGHSCEICRRFPWVEVIGIDADEDAINIAENKLKEAGCQFRIEISNFRKLSEVIDKLNVKEVDKALFDLGMSSMQIDISGRGFSFQKDEPLLMTMSKKPEESSLSAYEIVNSWSKEEIQKILKEYGEESFAGRIAEGIVKERKNKKIGTTGDLVKIIEDATPSFYHRKRIHPATKTFQALRIAVNDELNALVDGLSQAFRRLRKGGRIAVISFHGLEDRIVKNFFKGLALEEEATLIFKKPIVPTKEEININPRSRSAKLRVIEKK